LATRFSEPIKRYITENLAELTDTLDCLAIDNAVMMPMVNDGNAPRSNRRSYNCYVITTQVCNNYYTVIFTYVSLTI